MTPERIAELRKLAEAATLGKTTMGCGTGWPEHWAKHYKIETDIAYPVYHNDKTPLDKPNAVFDRNEDQGFYHAARTAIPELLNEIEALRARLDSARGVICELADCGEDAWGKDRPIQKLTREWLKENEE